MRSCAHIFVFSACTVLVVSTASAHGPQIQVTDTDNKITTRQLFMNSPYGDSLTGEKTVYVLPIRKAVSGSPSTDYWTVMPNDTIDPILNTNAYQFGPGLAYGYGHTFTDGYHFNVDFSDSLGWWNGAAFVSNPGLEAVGAFRGDSTSAEDQVFIDGSSVPSQGLVFSNISSSYDSDSHASMRFRMNGDGADALVEPSDGIYLLNLQISSTQPGLDPSSVISFVLYKNASWADVSAAVGSLGVDSSLVQYVAIPEPATGLLAVCGFAAIMARRRTRRRDEA